MAGSATGCAHARRDLETVDVGQLHVEQDEVGVELPAASIAAPPSPASPTTS